MEKVGQAEGSIDKEAIPGFKEAVNLVVGRYWKEFCPERNCEKITFCTLNYGKTLKIVLSPYPRTRSNYPYELKKLLEALDSWATRHASKEQKAVWYDGHNLYFKKTCVEVSLSNHEISFAALLPIGELYKILA